MSALDEPSLLLALRSDGYRNPKAEIGSTLPSSVARYRSIPVALLS
jgi:hypothetical protein